MADRIVVAFDGSEQAEAALEFAVDEWPDAVLTLLYVIDPTEAGYSPTAGVPSGAEEWYEGRKATAEAALSDGADLVGEGRTVETDTAVGRPADSIVEYADEHGFDLVVVGSHGRQGLSRIVLGSVAEAVVRRSPVPVTVVR